MIRDRLKTLGRKAALKVLGMERQAGADAPRPDARAGDFDPTVIPRVVDGSGDTPGPNHKTDIGRPWLVAQVASGVAPFLLDLRPPKECAGGTLPGAHVLPGWLVRADPARLPAKEQRVVVYDQTGSDLAVDVAAWLREQGWVNARRLVGGYAEWIEHGEPVAVPEAPPGGRFRVGDMVELKDGRRGWVMRSAPGPAWEVWIGPDEVVGPVGVDGLAP